MAHIRRRPIYGARTLSATQQPADDAISSDGDAIDRDQQQQAQQQQPPTKRADKAEDFFYYDDSDEEGDERPPVPSNTSYNFVHYLQLREYQHAGGVRRQQPLGSINDEHGTRHMLTHGMFREQSMSLNNMNKVFCSQWLGDRQIAFGTKCNKLMVYNLSTRQVDRIPPLQSLQQPHANQPQQQQQELECGIHALQLNPSKTLLATGAKASNDVAVYRLPTLDPVCVGENAHRDWIFDLCWLDDQFLVTGSRDTSVALWRVPDEDIERVEQTNGGPQYSSIQPLQVKPCKTAEKVRALVFNKGYNEVAALSLNGFIHIWSTEPFKQKLSRKLPFCMENVCLAVQDNGSLYAVGSKSHTALLDTRTLQAIRRIPSKYSGCGIRSATFRGNVLTIGTGLGMLMFYDVRAGKYLESGLATGRAVVLKATKGWVFPDDLLLHDMHHSRYNPAIYTHCYDDSGTRLFAAGGPLPVNLYGNYIALWQ